MRIGVDATCWANDRGYGRFTRELVSAMVVLGPTHEFVCVLDRRAADRFELSAPNVRRLVVHQSASPTRAATAGGHRSLLDMLRLGRAVAADRPDVFFFPTVYTYFPVPPRLATVVTVHDVIAERFPRLTLPSARARLFWRLKVRLALFQSPLVLTVSEFAAGEIAEVHRIARARIRVAVEAPSSAYRPSGSAAETQTAARRIGLPSGARWLTYVGGFNPHKNLITLIHAHREAARRLSEPLHLVFIGALDSHGFHSELPAIRQAIRASGTEHLVHWPGFLPDDEIRHLHSGAVALVLPSANEGFGLPAVEAAACDTPVIATTASPLPDLLQGGGIFVRPGDAGELAMAIERLAVDESLRHRLGMRAGEKARALDWRSGAKVALASLEETAG